MSEPDPFAETLRSWPEEARARFDDLRAVILRTAADIEGGEVSESLKWGEPAWRPKRPRRGSTLRACWQVKSPQSLALMVDCKTTLAATMQEIYPHEFSYENGRALRFPLAAPPPELVVEHLARLTFTYHLRG